MTIEQYLKHKTGYSIDDEAISTILEDRGVTPGSEVSSLSEKDKELCCADLYMYCATAPTIMNGREDSHGGWKHRESGYQSSAGDKSRLIVMADNIYKKYGLASSAPTFKIIKL